MSSTALPRNVASYLAAIDAAAVFVTMPLHVGAATIPVMKRMPRSTTIVWLAWTRKIEDAQQVEEARAIALDKSNAVAVVSATMGMARILGLIIDRREVGDAGAFDDMTDEELISAAARKARELGIAGPREVEDDNKKPR